MIRLDFLQIVKHKFLIVTIVVLEWNQFSNSVINIDETGLGDPARCLLLCQGIIKHQGQETIAFNQEIINQEFLIYGLYDFACFDNRLLIKVLCIKYF